MSLSGNKSLPQPKPSGEYAKAGPPHLRHVRLPRSAKSRRDLSFAILIHRIFPQRTMGDAFEGQRLKPGATIAEACLWPTPEWPERPILLEYCGSDRSGAGHHRSFHQYALWRYDPDVPEWVELATSSAVGIEWVDALKPIALRYLADTNTAPASGAADVTSRVLCLLDSELEPLQEQGRQGVLGMLLEQLMARLQAWPGL